MKSHFTKATKNGTMSSKDFWDLVVKPFLSNKEGLANRDISLVHNNSVVTDEQKNPVVRNPLAWLNIPEFLIIARSLA